MRVVQGSGWCRRWSDMVVHMPSTLGTTVRALLAVLMCLPSSAQTGERLLIPAPSQPKRAPLPAVKPPKIEDRVRSAAITASAIRVLITLTEQPLREVYRSVEAANSFAFENAEIALKAAIKEARPDSPRVARATQTRDAAVLSIRNQVASQVAARVQPQQDEMGTLLLNLGATAIRRIPLLNMIAAVIPAGALSLLEADSRVQEVALDDVKRADLSVSVAVLGAPTFWSNGFTGTGESVVVLDSGINAQHPGFGGTATGYTFVGEGCPLSERGSPADFNGHGTHVAGIVASRGTSAFPQHRGVAPGLSVVSAKISCSDGASFDSDALAAVSAALEVTPATIINNSNGGPAAGGDDAYSRRIDELVDTFNLVWVNSAGNSGPGPRTIRSPGIAYNAITVGNMNDRRSITRTDDVIANSSSRGPTADGRFKPDIVAPGTDIRSLDNASSGFADKTGTSMSAPHIAGAAALLRQAGVFGRLAIKALLINTTDTNGWQSDIGWGPANLSRAFAQRDNGISGSVSAERSDFRLFRGNLPTAGQFFATLTWNRTYRSGGANFLRDLDMRVYDAATSALRGESVTTIQNVEQVAFANGVGPVVLKVRADDDGRGYNEPFAVALSSPGFVPITGPAAGLACTAPGRVLPAASVTINCTVSNSGDTALVTPELSAALGSNPPSTIGNLASINPNTSASRAFTVTAPTSGTFFTVKVTAGSVMYGVAFSAARDVIIELGSGAPTRPLISANGIVNAASSQPGLSASQWVTIRGTNLAPVTRTLGFVNGAYPTVADGVSVTVDGKPAYLYYLSPTQINFVSPDLNRVGNVPVVVTKDGVPSDAINVTVQSTAPAAFLWPGGYAVATDVNYQFRVRSGTFSGVATSAAKPGEVIILWVTGLGPTNPAIPAGQQVPAGQLYSVANSVQVTIGGVRAELFGAALASGNASLYQIALRVPALGAGDHSVVTTVGGVPSVSALLTVQP